jgi:hypothetical protein
MNWGANPLGSYRVIVDLISSTTTNTGLAVASELDTNAYPEGIVVTNQEMAQINIFHAKFHDDWNYIIRPRPKQFAQLFPDKPIVRNPA